MMFRLITRLALVFPLLVLCTGRLAWARTQQPTAAAQATGTWTMAPAVVNAPWEVFATGSNIADAVALGSTLWATSSGGLLRWDRETGNLTQYVAPGVPLPTNQLSEIEPWQDGLIISGYGGVAVFDGDASWTLYRDSDIGLTVSYHAPMAVYEDAVWLASDNNLARLTPDGRWSKAPSDTTQPGLGGITKLESRADGLYVVYRLGAERTSPVQVSRYADGIWSIVDQPQREYFEDPSGALWRNQGFDNLERSADGGQTWKAVFSDLYFPEVVAIDPSGKLIVTSDDTLLVVSGDAILERYRFAAIGPELNYINILHWDEAGRLWIASDGRGLSRYDGQTFANWQPETSDLRDGAIRGLAVTPDTLYAGVYASAGDGGVSIFDIATETWTNLWPGETELSGGGVGGIAVAADGRAYFPTSAGVLDIWDGTHWEHIPMPVSEHSILSTSEALIDPEGHYWVGTEVGYGLGLFEYTGTDWRVYNIGSDISAVAQDSDGRLWLGSNNGLVVRDTDHTWHFYNGTSLGMSLPWVGDIAIDRKGLVWLTNTEDVVVFDGVKTFALSSSEAGQPSWGGVITLDAADEPWIAGMFGGLVHYQGEVPLSGFEGLTLQADRVVPEQDLLRTGSIEDLMNSSTPDSPIRSQLLNTGLTILAVSCGALIVILYIIVLVIRSYQSRTGGAPKPGA